MEITQEQFAQLHLFRCSGVGPISYQKLVNRFGSAQNALNALPDLAKTNKSLSFTPRKIIEKEVQALHKKGGVFIFIGDENYPYLLSQIADAPPVISVLGSPEVLRSPQVAIVGNRNASAHALKFTEEISLELALKGYTITSGMARGVDTAAHKGALVKSLPTIAVLAGGVDHIYPSENTALYAQIIKHGCIISEMPFGTQPTNQHFPRRNRIISGLSQATLVTEAPIKSGSLITARLAAEQGRDVFAVPGFPNDGRTQGPNLLLKEGAILVETAEDVLSNLKGPEELEHQNHSNIQRKTDLSLPLFAENQMQEPEKTEKKNKAEKTSKTHPKANANNTNNEISIETLLSGTPTSLDEIIRRSGMKEADVIIKLTEMEIFGEIERQKTGYILK